MSPQEPQQRSYPLSPLPVPAPCRRSHPTSFPAPVFGQAASIEAPALRPLPSPGLRRLQPEAGFVRRASPRPADRSGVAPSCQLFGSLERNPLPPPPLILPPLQPCRQTGCLALAFPRGRESQPSCGLVWPRWPSCCVLGHSTTAPLTGLLAGRPVNFFPCQKGAPCAPAPARPRVGAQCDQKRSESKVRRSSVNFFLPIFSQEGPSAPHRFNSPLGR